MSYTCLYVCVFAPAPTYEYLYLYKYTLKHFIQRPPSMIFMYMIGVVNLSLSYFATENEDKVLASKSEFRNEA